MRTDTHPALELRRQIGDVYRVDPPPPGLHRATWLITALMREPHDVEHHARARDLLAVVDLHRRLTDALAAATDPRTGRALHGLVGHATAELMGANREPGWRAAALDLLDPDGGPPPPLEHTDAVRLFTLAIERRHDRCACADAAD